MLGRGECFRANVCCPSSSCKMYYVVLPVYGNSLAGERPTRAAAASGTGGGIIGGIA